MSIDIQGGKELTGLGIGTILAYPMHRIGCQSLHFHLELDNKVALYNKSQGNTTSYCSAVSGEQLISGRPFLYCAIESVDDLDREGISSA
ncbi:predicted protein [Sclerotinia sclerotiorum 1980 UF-70]|uniref:Uncharacterized protein n=1 Tax=Sclerotinia sclerotiorum (strain ATCC 18683 / 1980 / Ss-1) TaxID=665079 RepID=A7E4S1_SCLS1|nr:predicted protein [Sclerotinia sclerotiorum 1980 UF-70]EDN90893.1 predicted protein [Sclerotinia sclerotiorum 1980 UF-70]